MKHKRIPIIIIAVVVIATLVFWWQGRAGTAVSNDIITAGFIEATDVAVAPEIPGRILFINAAEGDQVKAGTALVKLDDSLLKAQQKQAEAVVAQSQAAVEQAQAGAEQAQAGLQQTVTAKTQTLAMRDGAKKAWDDALNVQKFPLEIDARLVAAQGQATIAKSNLEMATDNFRKISYPYTYSTFSFDVPTAVGLMVDAIVQIDDTAKKLNANLTADQTAALIQSLQSASADLNKGRELLARGQGTDVFTSGALNVRDFWTLRAAQLQMDQAQAALDTAVKTLQITQDIRNNPQQINAAVDAAKTAYDIATAGADVADKAVATATSQVATAQKLVGVAQKQVEASQAALEIIKVQVGRTTLTAPVSGTIASRNAEAGEIAQAGAQILVISQLEKMTVTAYVPESRIGVLKLGQKAIINVDTFPGQDFTGEISYISPRALFTPGNVQLKEEREKTVFPVKIKLDNPEQKLKPGMSADVRIPASS